MNIRRATSFSILLIFITIVMSGCSKTEEKTEAEVKTVQVATAIVESESIESQRQFSGSVSSEMTAVIIPKVVGYVENIYLNPGESFKKSDSLVTLKSTELEEKMRFAESSVEEAENGLKQAEIGLRMAKSQLNQAQSQYELAKKTYDRYSNLIQNNSVSRQEFDQVEAKYRLAAEQKDIAKQSVELADEKLAQVKLKKNQAEAMLAEVRAYLSYTEIKAPFDGVVLEKMMDAGNLAAPGNPILKIGNHDAVINAFINESLINDIKVGMMADVMVDSINFKCVSKIIEISPDIDPATRNFKIKLKGNDKLVPGMYAKISLGIGSKDIVSVPESAVVQRGQLTVVFVNSDDKADMRFVKTGETTDGYVEILSGLKPGEEIVVENARSLKTGNKLEVQ